MASNFMEKHKRKSLLAALLLLLGGRGKYVVLFVLAAAVSVPFLISGERLALIFSSGPLGALARAAGITSLLEGRGGYPAGQDMLSSAAMAAAMAPGSKASFWDRYLRAANAPLPPAGSPSTMGMLRGGGDLAGPVQVKDKPGEKPKGAGQVKGVVNKDEREKGDAPEGVDISGMLGMAGGDAAGGSMGEELASRASPYFNRSMMSSSGGALDRSAEMFSRSLDNHGDIPVPSNPKSLNRKTGKVSGFAWRNLGRKSKRSAAMGSSMNSKKARYQLAETVSMAGIAFLPSSMEYEATYSGATYDGLDVESNVLTAGDAVAPTVAADTSFAGNLMTDVGNLLDEAQACAAEAGKHAEVASTNLQAMSDILKNEMDFSNPPGPCFWEGAARDRWNRKLDRVIAHCNKVNASSVQLDALCSSTTDEVDCQEYNKLKRHYNWWKCVKKIFMALGVMLLVGPVIFVCLMTGVFGADAQNFTKGIINKMAGIENPEMPEVADPGTRRVKEGE